MRIFHRAAAAVALLSAATLAACQGGVDASGAAIDTDDQQASYAVGFSMGQSLVPVADRIDTQAFLRGVQEAMGEEDPAIPQDSLQAILQRFAQDAQQAQQERMAAEAEAALARGEEFLTENAERPEVTVTESGLQYEVLEEGEGESPTADDQVRIHYTGQLIDETEFDSSRDGEPVTFPVGGVIPGFAEGLQLMKPGATYRFYVPSDLAYGEQGSPPNIPGNATLIFDVELLEVVDQPGQGAQGGQGD